jgi:hypothetical protein
MLTRTAIVAWAVGALGLALMFTFWHNDVVAWAGLGLAILGPLLALWAVIWERRPEAVFVFLLSLVPLVLMAVVLYLVAKDAN